MYIFFNMCDISYIILFTILYYYLRICFIDVIVFVLLLLFIGVFSA